VTRQSARHVGEPTGLRQRRDLGSDEADSHEQRLADSG
jgi:hypothetical protein